MATQTSVDAFVKSQRGSFRRMPLTEDDFRMLGRERPNCIAVDGDAVLVAEPLKERIDLHYAFPDTAAFERQFAAMLERVVRGFNVIDAPFGVNVRIAGLPTPTSVELTLFAQAFQVIRDWTWMELDSLPSGGSLDETVAEGFRLRRAGPDDVDAIVALIHASFHNPGVNPRSWSDALEKGREIRLLENATGRTAGLLHLREENEASGYVSELAVHPDFQGRGLGEALMRWTLAWFRSQGFRRAALTTSPENARAIALYEKLGFVITETGVDYRRSLDDDEVRQLLEKRAPARGS